MSEAARAPRIALVVDHPRRDLAGIVLTAHELCQRGAICHLVPLNLQDQELWALAPDFVLLNFLRRGNDALARRLLDAGIGLGLLDTEGGVWSEPDAYIELLWNDVPLLHRVRAACLWGPRMADELIGRGLLKASRVSVTGCPRFDLYHPDWQSVLRRADANGRKRILINTNFSLSNPKFASVEQNIRQFREEFDWSEARVNEYVDAEQRGIAGMIELAATLTRDCPDVEVILRPHPFEDAEHYRSALAGEPRVIVDNQGPVQPEIFAAAAVIQRSCSTAIEAGLCGVPALSPQWIAAPAVIPMAERVSLACDSYADMRCAIEAILEQRYRPPTPVVQAIEEVIRDWFCRVDGAAHRRVCDTVMAEALESTGADPDKCSRFLYGLDLPEDRGMGGIARRVRRVLRRSPDWSFRRLGPTPPSWWEASDKAFSTAEVAALAERIGAAKAAAGAAVGAVTVGRALERGDYRSPYGGYAVTMAPEAGPASVRSPLR